MRLDLDKAASGLADGEANLGDWLLKLDAGKWPIVVGPTGLAIIGAVDRVRGSTHPSPIQNCSVRRSRSSSRWA